MMQELGTSQEGSQRGGSAQGISLVEILVAITLLAVGALSAVTMQRQSTKANQGSYSREAAASLARQLLEAAANLSYSDACLNDTAGSFVAPCNALGLGTNPVNAQGLNVAAGGFSRTWNISANVATPTSNTVNFKTIQVRVTWDDRGQTNQLDLSSIKGW